MLIFPDLPDVQVEEVEVAGEITLTLRTTSSMAPCPSCGTPSSHIQSRYTRTLRDLPSCGRPIRLIVHVRRFFCHKSNCTQKIFAERLPELCRPYAQRTTRLQEALCQLGLRVGGQSGAGAGSELGLSGSRDTILRLVRRWKQSAHPPPRVIGLDDWAHKRRLRYGTLICDLERSRPIDLLPDRAVESVAAWLKQHPSLEVVSRDGSSEYAAAIRQGAPQGRQVSDRWHLVKNLTACVSVQLAKTLAGLRRAEAGRPAPTQAIHQVQQARAAERTARYEHILELHTQGVKSGEIAKTLGMSQRTIQRWIAMGTIPYAHRKRPRASLIDPYKSYLLKRWHQGCHSGAQLERELRAKGYTGSPHGVYRYLQTLKALKLVPSMPKRAAKPASSIQPKPLLTLSASQATWLFFRKPEDLKPEEQETLRQLRQASPQLEVAYQLVDDFLHMVRERTGDQLDAWLHKVEASQLPAFHTFVTGVQKDKDAVLAGLTLPWSTGPVEGHVNRLKLIKRSMYGRAEFDLLKLRVLHQSKKSQDRKDKYKHRKGAQVDRLQKPRRMKHSTIPQHTILGNSEAA